MKNVYYLSTQLLTNITNRLKYLINTSSKFTLSGFMNSSLYDEYLYDMSVTNQLVAGNLTTLSDPYSKITRITNLFSMPSLSVVNLPITSSLCSFFFRSISTLTSVYLGSCYDIYDETFCYCVNLQQVDLPKTYRLSERVFAGCYNLTNVSVPQCYSIGGFAFAECSQLQTISFNNMSDIIWGAFDYCTKLESVYIYGSSVAWQSSAFDHTPITDSTYLGHYGSIYVPASLVDSYKANTQWLSLGARITSI